ncbi:hypothetical protein [Azospirillum rugosum]|uniref:Ogr/Delta-like zinc finger n=1 Tax=Azospirillum rugosum TaxID=416170 RepID=A0ABS4SH36_9PROT|nr:hypothetical protein [Azospirillum rugosum]MBP2290740.1 hypothetical protein [Azospirillum rugosum]MDQ0525629.1 hypothetical protein [Azospirillum rugosum]
MSTTDFTIKAGSVPACPKCGNQQHFRAHSERVAEDCCEVWVTCRCGHDLTQDDNSERMEDVWGALDRETIINAMRCTWISLLPATTTAPAGA